LRPLVVEKGQEGVAAVTRCSVLSARLAIECSGIPWVLLAVAACGSHGVAQEAAPHVAEAVTGTIWQNQSFAPQTGPMTVEFDAVPSANNKDMVINLSNGPASAYTDLAAIVRFASNGVIDVRNGSTYSASTPSHKLAIYAKVLSQERIQAHFNAAH
jgi:hypothetical protein